MQEKNTLVRLTRQSTYHDVFNREVKDSSEYALLPSVANSQFRIDGESGLSYTVKLSHAFVEWANTLEGTPSYYSS